MCSLSNLKNVSSCMFTRFQIQNKDVHNSWILQESDDFYRSHITAPIRADATDYNKNIKDEPQETSKPLREKNLKKSTGHKHVPHKDKPPQVVAKRNARERRRVQAVNSAFVRLRKALPIENSRGKRVSKVKTLQNAIQYIQGLQQLIQDDQTYYPISNDCSFDDTSNNHEDILEEFFFES
ncbi:hypothetical protein RN001_003322 [Aquatica leii]|uniref:BHLH domain-containing protein n=1 Tax=Aquatica leii TaxID=1421715 RepID=A0AAN7PNI4_9COLE|nr:hypothetical protein RN001_003322 [Aquatica leii]